MLDDPIFTVGKIAKAVGLPTATIKSWYQQGHVALGLEDVEARDKGMARLFTLRTVHQLAITASLSRLGMKVSEANRLAMTATDMRLTGRTKTLLFPRGHTYLVIDPAGSRAIVQNVVPEEVGNNILGILSPFEGPEPDTIIRIDLSHLFQRVRSTLGIEGAAP